jgi:hypothetical protein
MLAGYILNVGYTTICTPPKKKEAKKRKVIIVRFIKKIMNTNLKGAAGGCSTISQPILVLK